MNAAIQAVGSAKAELADVINLRNDFIKHRDNYKARYMQAKTDYGKICDSLRQVESLVSELIDRAKGLTGTERVILRYYAEGYAVKDISGLLFISVGTVKGHNSHIYSKLGVDSYDSLKAYLDVLRRCERLEELLQGGGK